MINTYKIGIFIDAQGQLHNGRIERMIKRLKKFMTLSVTFLMLSSCFTNIAYAAESNTVNNKNAIESNETKDNNNDKNKPYKK